MQELLLGQGQAATTACVESGRLTIQIVVGARLIHLLAQASARCAIGSHGNGLSVNAMVGARDRELMNCGAWLPPSTINN